MTPLLSLDAEAFLLFEEFTTLWGWFRKSDRKSGIYQLLAFEHSGIKRVDRPASEFNRGSNMEAIQLSPWTERLALILAHASSAYQH